MTEQYLEINNIKPNKAILVKRRKITKGEMEPYFYLIPAFIIFGLFVFYPFVKTIIMSVSPQMFLVIFMNLINAFQAFGQIKLLTQGGPGDSTNVLVHSIYREAFFNGRFEMACAQALILFVIMMIVTLLQFKFEKKGVHYQ